MARAEIYACLSRLMASPEGSIARGWLEYDALIEHLQVASEALPYEFSAAELVAAALDYETSDAEMLAKDIGKSFSALFEVGDRGPPLAIREELAPGANAAAKEEVARFFEHFGYQLGEDYAWRPDHLSVLLEFMHFLAWHEANSDDDALRNGLQRAQRDFLQRHLHWWVGDLARTVAERSDAHALLKATLNLAHAFVDHEHQWLVDSTATS